jgi:negative regulator of sigma E activity
LLLILLYFTGSMVLFQATQCWVPPAVPLTLLACVLLSALLLTSPGKGPKQPYSTDCTEEENNTK